MSTRRIRPLAALLATALLASACGATASPDGGSQGLTPSAAATSLASASASASPSASASASPSASAMTYTVRGGDTLSSIARAWGTSVAQLQAWNAARYPSLADDPHRLEAGWVLVVSGDPHATPLPLPTVRPSAGPTSAGGGCRAGNRVAAGTPQTLSRISGAGAGVALTFDMGGRLDPGVEILNFLIANGVCATIFPTGAMADSSQGQQVMAIIRDHPELFEVGNHTLHHCDLVRGGGGSPSAEPCEGITPTAEFIGQELGEAAAIITQQTGQDPRPYCRPPYGSTNASVLAAAAAAGYTKTLMWDIDTIDWRPISDGGPTAQQISGKVVANAQSGSVVLMHLGGYETLAALQAMVPGLRERGFVLTSISDLLN